jgi:hypothetical protein
MFKKICPCLAPKKANQNPHPYDQFADAPAPGAENTKTKANRHLTESAFPNEDESAIANLKLQQCKLEKRILDLEHQENACKKKIITSLQTGNKAAAKNQLAMKRFVVETCGDYRMKLMMVEKMQINIDQTKDNVAFTKV